MLAGGEDLSIDGAGTVGQQLILIRPATDPTASGDLGLTPTMSGWRGKRVLDVCVAVVLFVLALPVLLMIALAIKATSPGPVLFRQRRVGRAGSEFRILKFRTMRVDAEQQLEADGELRQLFVQGSHKIPSHIDPRVTRVGRFLRRTSLDELPQLLNVLAGHMSMVGPRPVERSQFELDYDGFEPAYLGLRPGLTGLWQVSGRSTIQFPERAQLDTHYMSNCGPWIDVMILARTPRVLITGLGAG